MLQEEEPCRNEGLHVENKMLRAKVQKLEAKVKDLNQQLLKNHATGNKLMTLLLCQLSGPLSSPFA